MSEHFKKISFEESIPQRISDKNEEILYAQITHHTRPYWWKNAWHREQKTHVFTHFKSSKHGAGA